MYYNRDLSWLDFNFRVLHEAAEERVPLYERLKFLSIFSSNMDEFFRVRYPVVTAIAELGKKTREKIGGASKTVLEEMQGQVELQLQHYGKTLTEKLLPALESEGIHVYYNEDIKEEHDNEVREFFLSKILSFIQPIFLEENDSKDFMPENNQLYFIVSLQSGKNEHLHYAIVNIPSDKIKRFYCPKPIDGKHYVIFIDDIIRQNMQNIFPGFEIKGIYTIKLNRDADIDIDDDYSTNIAKKIEKQLQKREMGPPSRFLYEEAMPRNIQMFLATKFGLKHEEVFSGGRYHNLRDFAKFPSFGKGLFYEELPPISLSVFYDGGDLFKAIKEKDILIHLPYYSYNPILAFFNQAAVDPEVDEIFITLYRIASDSLIANALISAAKNGKKVTVFIELKARFDEANNLNWSRKMQDAGIQIVYSIPGIKVHAKTALVTKKKGAGKDAYAILSTGNFNELTARFYTDHVLFTCEKSITSELFVLFHFLQKRQVPSREGGLKFKTLLVSQSNMIERFEALIEGQIKRVKKKGSGRIRVKVNNLEEPYMIDLLYKASQAGVKVDILARSICCIIPGVQARSENITVKRLVDRYLEHSRLFIFGEDEDAVVIMGSADWMTRNLRNRIEVCFPIMEEQCRQEILEYFNIQWSDNDKAVRLTPDMQQERIVASDEPVINAQQEIYKYLSGKR